MPTVLRARGFRFFFYSNEGSPREPIHVHVEKGDATAKLWIEPQVALAESYGFSSGELRQIAALVEENAQRFREAWHEFFGE